MATVPQSRTTSRLPYRYEPSIAHIPWSYARRLKFGHALSQNRNNQLWWCSLSSTYNISYTRTPVRIQRTNIINHPSRNKFTRSNCHRGRGEPISISELSHQLRRRLYQLRLHLCRIVHRNQFYHRWSPTQALTDRRRTTTFINQSCLIRLPLFRLYPPVSYRGAIVWS